MAPTYEHSFIKNVFQQLDTECSLFVLSLCLASHDMALHHRLLNDGQAEERTYFFAVALSILREVAKIIARVDKFASILRFSPTTKDLLRDIKERLASFQDDGLIRQSLKPIRDLAFHYDLAKADARRTGLLLEELKNEDRLDVRAATGVTSIMCNRYTFADAFRSRFVDSYLTQDIVRQISEATVNVIAFTDSLLADLSHAVD